MSTKTELRIYNSTLAYQQRLMKKKLKAKQIPKKVIPEIDRLKANVRKETRESHLALGFLRGTKYLAMEATLRPRNEGHVSTHGMTKLWPDFDNVLALVQQFGSRYFDNDSQLKQQFTQWLDEAGALEPKTVEV